VVTLVLEGPPPAEERAPLNAADAKPGPGQAKAAGRGMMMAPMGAAPAGLAGPARGVGGPAPGMMLPRPQVRSLSCAALAGAGDTGLTVCERVQMSAPPAIHPGGMPMGGPPRPGMGPPPGMRPPLQFGAPGMPPPGMAAPGMAPPGFHPGMGPPPGFHPGMPPPGFPQGPPGTRPPM